MLIDLFMLNVQTPINALNVRRQQKTEQCLDKETMVSNSDGSPHVAHAIMLVITKQSRAQDNWWKTPRGIEPIEHGK